MLKKICNILIQLSIICLIIFPPIVFGAVEFRYITYIHITILAIGVIWLIKSFAKGRIHYFPTPLDLPLLIFIGWGIVNLIFSTYKYPTERELYLVIYYAFFYFLVVQQLKTTRRLIGLAFIIVLVGSAESVFGLFQYFQGATTILGHETPNIGTVNATYFSHNHFAGFLILVIPLALGLFFASSNFEKKFFLLLLIGIMGTALVLTLSRGGVFSLFLAVGFFLLWFFVKNVRRRSLWPRYLLLLLVLIFVLSLHKLRQ